MRPRTNALAAVDPDGEHGEAMDRALQLTKGRVLAAILPSLGQMLHAVVFVAGKGTTLQRNRPDGLTPPPPRRPVRQRVDAHHQQQVDRLDNVIRTAHRDGSSARRTGEQLRMLHVQRPAIGKMDLEGLKRPLLIQLANLLDCHGS